MGRAVHLRGPPPSLLRDHHRESGADLAVRRLRDPAESPGLATSAQRRFPAGAASAGAGGQPAARSSRSVPPAAIRPRSQRYLAERHEHHRRSAGAVTVSYQGQVISPIGSLAALGPRSRPRRLGSAAMPGTYELGPYHNSEDAASVYGGASQAQHGPASTASPHARPVRGDVHVRVQELLPSVRGRPDQQLNQTSVAGMLDPGFLATLDLPYTGRGLHTARQQYRHGHARGPGHRRLHRRPLRELQLGAALPHPGDDRGAPVSNNQRFAEAQKWFHLRLRPDQHGHQRAAAAALLEILRVPARRRYPEHQHPAQPAEHAGLRSSTRRSSRPRRTSSPATTRFSPIRSARMSSLAPGRAPTSGTS